MMLRQVVFESTLFGVVVSFSAKPKVTHFDVDSHPKKQDGRMIGGVGTSTGICRKLINLGTSILGVRFLRISGLV